MASLVPYVKWKLTQFGDRVNAIDFDTDDIQVAMLTSGYTPDTTGTGHTFWSDVSTFQVPTGAAYTGPVSLTAKTLTFSGADVFVDAGDVTIAKDETTGFSTARYIVMFRNTGTPSTSRLIGVGDMLTNQSNVAGQFQIIWAASGIIKF